MTHSSLVADNLSVSRGNTTVLDAVSFSVEQGSVFALLGGNGAGKSTTLLTFLGFISPVSGNVLVNNVDVAENLAATRQAIAYLPEAATLYEHLNAYENLSYFLSLSGVKIRRSDIDSALDKVSLVQGSRNKKLRTYSKGMRQKVAIALALLRDTDILLLDEPTSGLDPIAIDEFHQLIGNLSQQGKTILMVTHDVYGACQVADRIALLRHGSLVGEFSAPAEGNIQTELVHQEFSKGRS
ncbi:ABC transporter ATP-binding protein [Marinicella sp. W31]|uniref:ABC transporter ATP-binding protein n=1 Tax=Marinicella sp. W31 TaxID=3023713 RepID=UPI003757C740